MCSFKEQKVRKGEIEMFLYQKVMELDQTEWASSIGFSLKTNRKLRFCKDYRKTTTWQNETWIRYLKWTSASTIFAKSYHFPLHTQIAYTNRQKLTKLTEPNLFHFQPQTLSVHPYAAGVTQRPRHLSAHSGRHPLQNTIQDHPLSLEKHCDLLQISTKTYWQRPSSAFSFVQSRPLFGSERCRFLSETLNYSELLIRHWPLEIASHTTDATSRLKASTNNTELRSCKVFYSIFRRFVPIFARLSAPKNAKLLKDQPATFGSLKDEELKFMSLFKAALQSPALFPFPNSTGRTTFDTEVVIVQVRGMLLQIRPDNTTKSVGY